MYTGRSDSWPMVSMMALFLGGGEEAEAQAVGIDFGFGGQDAHGELFAAHFQAEDAGAGAVAGGVEADVEGEGAFAHSGAGAEDYHIGALDAAQ